MQAHRPQTSHRVPHQDSRALRPIERQDSLKLHFFRSWKDRFVGFLLQNESICYRLSPSESLESRPHRGTSSSISQISHWIRFFTPSTRVSCCNASFPTFQAVPATPCPSPQIHANLIRRAHRRRSPAPRHPSTLGGMPRPITEVTLRSTFWNSTRERELALLSSNASRVAQKASTSASCRVRPSTDSAFAR